LHTDPFGFLSKSRIVVAENLPGDPSYQNIKKIFSAVGRYGYCNMDELSSFFLPRIIKKVIFCHVPV